MKLLSVESKISTLFLLQSYIGYFAISICLRINILEVKLSQLTTVVVQALCKTY